MPPAAGKLQSPPEWRQQPKGMRANAKGRDWRMWYSALQEYVMTEVIQQERNV